MQQIQYNFLHTFLKKFCKAKQNIKMYKKKFRAFTIEKKIIQASQSVRE